MKQDRVALVLIAANLIGFMVIASSTHAVSPGTAYLGVLTSIAAGAIVRRTRSRRLRGDRSALDLPVVLASLAAFDAIVAIGIRFGHRG